MYRITLEWSDIDRTRTKTISAEDSTHFPPKIIIGRGEEKVCDVVIKHQDPKIINTVSSLHLELFFDAEKNCFFAKNLTQNRQYPKLPNPAIINGKKVIKEIVKIEEGTLIQLGKIIIKVTVLELKQVNSQFLLQCSNTKTPHIVEPKYEGLNCPICGYIVFNGTMLKL